MKAKLFWLQAGDEPEAHFCAVSDDGRKAASVCGYASTAQWHRPLHDMTSCQKCDYIESSGKPINFTIPDGRTIQVRGHVAPH